MRSGVIVIAVIAGAAALLSCTTFLLLEPIGTPPVPLTRDLPEHTADIGPAFDKRVEARFPLGSSAPSMAGELQRQGFVRQPPLLNNEEFEALRTESGMPCRFDFTIRWRVDLQERLTSVHGAVYPWCL